MASRSEKPLSVIVKHANPCGVAYGKTQEEAYRLSFATDPKSAFGGVIGFDRTVDVDTAQAIGDSFVEVLLAPGYEPEALTAPHGEEAQSQSSGHRRSAAKEG